MDQKKLSDLLIGGNNTGIFIVDVGAGYSGSGTFTRIVDQVPTIERTASALTDTYQIVIPMRVSADWEITFHEAHCRYSVNTADLDDVTFTFSLFDVPPDGNNTWSSHSGYTTRGNADGDYDEAHNTAAERGDDTGAPEYHTAVVTLDGIVGGGTNGVGTNGVLFTVSVLVNGDAGAAGIFRLHSIAITYTEQYVA